MFSCISEILANGSSCERSIISQCSRIRSSCSNHYGIIQGSVLPESIYNIRYCRSLLTDSYIYTVNRLACLVGTALIDDGIKGNRCLSSLTVTDNELSLSPANRNHGIYCLETCLQRLRNRLTEDHSRSLSLERHLHQITSQPSLAVKRFPQRVHNPSKHRFPDVYRSDTACASYGHSLLDPVCRTQKNCSHIVFFQIHDNRHDTVIKLQKLTSLSVEQTIKAHNTITDLQYLADLFILKFGSDFLQLTEQHIRYFRWANCI